MEKHCKSSGGYSGIKNVYQADPVKDDVQQSFFLAETLKVIITVWLSSISLAHPSELSFNIYVSSINGVYWENIGYISYIEHVLCML